MDTNQINGIKIIVIAIILIVVMVLLDPKQQVAISGVIGTLFAFGGMLASGNWPYTPKHRRRRRIGQSRLDYWLKPIKDLVVPSSRRSSR